MTPCSCVTGAPTYSSIGCEAQGYQNMKIDRIDVYHTAHPMQEAWSTAYGSDETVNGVLVRMCSGDREGWSESNPLEFPTYTPEYAAGVFRLLTEVMAPLVVGREMETADDILAALQEFKGNNFAKAALEIAWWQLQSSLTEKPLYALLGGRMRDIQVGEALGISSDLDELLERIGTAFAQGFSRVKLKVRPDRDLEVLQEVRRAFPDGQFHIDGNCGYSFDDLAMFHALDELQLMMIEQPLGYGDLHEHAKLQRAIRTPICLDESCTSVAATRAAIDLGACKIVNIKPARVGGLGNAMRILSLCREAGIPCWVGSMLETSVGAAANLAFASLPGITLPCDAFPSRRFYQQEITAAELVLSGPGTMRPLDVPSDGHLPLEARLQGRTIERRSLTA